MGIEPGNGNPGLGDPGLDQASPRQIELGEDGFLGNVGGHGRKRDMRRHARIPDLFQHVEFPHLLAMLQHIGDEADFVVIARIGKAHGLLVEGREAYRIDFAVTAKLKGLAEVLDGKAPACKGRLPLADIARRQIAKIHECAGCLQRPIDFIHGHWLQLQLYSRRRSALVKNASVSDHHQPSSFAYTLRYKQPGRQFWTNPRRVAHDKGNERTMNRVHVIHFVCSIWSECSNAIGARR